MRNIFVSIFIFFPLSFASASSGGFLKERAPDGLKDLPPPPTIGSAQFKSDIHDYRAGAEQKGSSRWLQAISDSDMSRKNLEIFFSGPMGENISQEKTPAISNIIEMIRYDAGYYSTIKVKEKYKRERPFVYFKASSCTPDKENELKNSYSYPSGHAATAQTLALVLSEIKPSRRNQLLKAANSYGESRVICGVHWQSDVIAGFKMGGVLFSNLNSDNEFMSALEKAKKELRN